MDELPEIKNEKSTIDTIIEVLTILTLIAMWVIPIWHYESLSAEIPIHFNFSGEPDSYSSRIMIFLLPAIGTVIFLLVKFINQHPHRFNYPVKITEENQRFQYSNATRMLRLINFAILFVFTIITNEIILISIKEKQSLDIRIMIVLICIIFFPVIYFLIRSYRGK